MAEIAGVVIESTFNWYWLVDGSQEAGYTVHAANTAAIKKYDGLKHSGGDQGRHDLLCSLDTDWLMGADLSA